MLGKSMLKTLSEAESERFHFRFLLIINRDEDDFVVWLKYSNVVISYPSFVVFFFLKSPTIMSGNLT